MILSLDISTSCTGYCIFDQNTIVDYGHIDLSKHKDFFEKAYIVKSRIREIQKKYKITNVVVEENLQAFRPGLSSANTLMKLAQFNGTVQWICHETFNIIPKALNVNRARKLVNLKIDRKNKNISTKDQVLNFVHNQEPNILFPKKVLKSGPRKGLEVYENASYDIADAYVIGKAYLIEN